ETDTHSAIMSALRAFATAGGKKIVLLLTSDSATNDIRPTMMPWSTDPLANEKLTTILRNQLIQEANASNVNLYVINVEGLRNKNTNNGMLYWLARETGGRLMPGNDLRESLQIFDTVSSNFYSLAY